MYIREVTLSVVFFAWLECLCIIADRHLKCRLIFKAPLFWNYDVFIWANKFSLGNEIWTFMLVLLSVPIFFMVWDSLNYVHGMWKYEIVKSVENIFKQNVPISWNYIWKLTITKIKHYFNRVNFCIVVKKGILWNIVKHNDANLSGYVFVHRKSAMV